MPPCHLCEEKRGRGSSHAGAGQGPGQAPHLSHHAWAGNPPPCPWGCRALSDGCSPPTRGAAAPWFAAEDHRRAESWCAFLQARPSPICRTCLWLAVPQGRLHAASCSPSSNTNSTLGSSCQNPRLASTGKHQALPLPKAMCSH